MVLRLKRPSSPLLPMMAWLGSFILPRHLYEGRDFATNPANGAPVGTGPFRFQEWVKGERIVLEANKGYFRSGPYVDRLEFRILKDTSTATDLLLRGDVDYSLVRPSFQRLAELRRAPGMKVATFAHPARYYLGFNLSRAPWGDPRVRRAVNQGLDRAVLVDKALLGYGAPAMGFYTPAVAWAYNPAAVVPPFDRAEASRLLGDAGLKAATGGNRASGTLVTASIPPYPDIAAEVAAQLREIGVQLSVVALAPADWTRRVARERDYDMFLTDGSWGPDPDNLTVRFGSAGGAQYTGYASAEFDAAVAAGALASRLADRARVYFRAQEILARDLPIAPLAEYVQVIPVRDAVRGLPQTEARGLVTFYDFSLVRLR